MEGKHAREVKSVKKEKSRGQNQPGKSQWWTRLFSSSGLLRRLYLGTGRNVAASTEDELDEVFDVAIAGDVDEMEVTQVLLERLERP